MSAMDSHGIVEKNLVREEGCRHRRNGFHMSQNRKRAFIAANKVGKTYWGAAEAWFHLLSDHPYREVPQPGSTGWVLCSDLRTGWETISEVMHELEPPGVLGESCKYVPGIGYLYRSQKILRTINGSQMVGKGCEQSLLALESKRVQWAWIDEPPKGKPLAWSPCATHDGYGALLDDTYTRGQTGRLVATHAGGLCRGQC